MAARPWTRGDGSDAPDEAIEGPALLWSLAAGGLVLGVAAQGLFGVVAGNTILFGIVNGIVGLLFLLGSVSLGVGVAETLRRNPVLAVATGAILAVTSVLVRALQSYVVPEGAVVAAGILGMIASVCAPAGVTLVVLGLLRSQR